MALLLALVPVAGAAQDEGSVQEFRAHVERGVELRKAGKSRKALAAFKQARAIADHPKLALTTGRLYEDIGDCGSARTAFVQGRDDARTSEDLAQKFDEAIAANQECVDRGELVVECHPMGSSLKIDGSTHTCPAELELAAGEHNIEASAPEHQTKSVVVSVEPAGEHHHKIELVEAQPEVAWQETAVTYTTYGALGLGGAFLVGGIVSDASASSRQEELVEASRRGDLQDTRRLAEEAESAQVRTVAFYSTAAVLLAGGAVLWVYGAEAEALLGEDDASASTKLHVTPDGAVLEATFRW